MAENQGRDREIPRRETEKMRSESIVLEMASAVRVLGGDGPALTQNNKAARAARLREIDGDFYGPEIDRLGSVGNPSRLLAD